MSTKINVKLLTDKKTSRVLFAEAGKDFVDFLFSLLTLPTGSVVSLLTEQSRAASVEKIYESVKKLNDIYMVPNRDKTELLQPKIVCSSICKNLLMLEDVSGNAPKYYTCGNGSYNRHYYITTVKGTPCPSCLSGMSSETTTVVPTTSSSQGDGKGGYVTDIVTYMITDDLVITPLSTISCFTILNKFSIKDVSTLEEMAVVVGMEEGLNLLKASLESTTPLTDVFLGKQSYPTSLDGA